MAPPIDIVEILDDEEDDDEGDRRHQGAVETDLEDGDGDSDDKDEDDADVTEAELLDPARHPFEAMVNAGSGEMVRDVLMRICANNMERRNEALRLMLAFDEGRETKAVGADRASLKRGRTETCCGCGEDFDSAANKEGLCGYYRYHPA